MTNKLISLVIIIFILSISHSYSDVKFLFPKEKPSIFKKINKNQGENFSSNLPQKKPIIKDDKTQEIQVLKEEKIIEKKEVEVKIEQKKRTEEKIKVGFIFPQKKLPAPRAAASVARPGR